MLDHHTPSKKKLLKKTRDHDKDTWRNRQVAKDKRYNRKKERYTEF